ncbi:MAG: glutathione S-transferase N-terminal domain-containing protein [Maricaulaceae bacterium]
MTVSDPIAARGAYHLIGAPLSLFTGKVRGYLRWKNLPFCEAPATREVYKSVIVPRVGWPVIPVVITPEGDTLQDTTEIIDSLEAREGGPGVYPTTPRQRLAALLFEVMGDEWLLQPAMHYRWAYNADWAHLEFGRTAFPHLPEDEQREAGKKAAERFQGALPFLGINEASAPAIERLYLAFLELFDAHLAAHPQLFGHRPSIGDYGLLGPLYAHLLRDPASGPVMQARAPRVADWARRTHAPQHSLTGGFLDDDATPPTLVPLLALWAREGLPVLLDAAAQLARWTVATPEHQGALPRVTGFHKVRFDGVEADRAVFPYSVWMLQRIVDALAAAEREDRANVHAFLHTIGADVLIDYTPPVRVARRNFQIVLATQADPVWSPL